MKLEVRPLVLPEIKLIHSPSIVDERGHFAETYVRRDFAVLGIDQEFVQDNQSISGATGTVRGLHFQTRPFAQTKLIRVLRGCLFSICVDLRRSSPRYGEYVATELAGDSGHQLFIPTGFAHGYCTLEPDTEVFYKVDAPSSPPHEFGIHWLDPTLAIPWPIHKNEATISEKDAALPFLRDLPSYFE